MGHSMSSDPAKLRFFIWPLPKFKKFYEEKGFWAQRSKNFWNRICISKIM